VGRVIASRRKRQRTSEQQEERAAAVAPIRREASNGAAFFDAPAGLTTLPDRSTCVAMQMVWPDPDITAILHEMKRINNDYNNNTHSDINVGCTELAPVWWAARIIAAAPEHHAPDNHVPDSTAGQQVTLALPTSATPYGEVTRVDEYDDPEAIDQDFAYIRHFLNED
jgi:hypothetical protein